MASLKKRGDVYYVQYYLAGQQCRISLNTSSYQVARERLRQFESTQARGEANRLSTRTPIPEVLTAYGQHIRTIKTADPRRWWSGAAGGWPRGGLCGGVISSCLVPGRRRRRRRIR